MRRRFLSLFIFAALLVGCAASAMHYGPPATAVAQNSGAHVHPNTVTGPCYKPTGGDCASTYHVVHGQIVLNTSAACSTGSGCGFTGYELLAGSAVFANTNYDCNAYGEDGGDSVDMQAIPSATDEVIFGFRNLTGHTIPNNTAFTINFTCDGA
jgi:hypothetical protein